MVSSSSPQTRPGAAQTFERASGGEDTFFDAPDDASTCRECGATMHLPFGLEPTERCNECAQAAVARVVELLRAMHVTPTSANHYDIGYATGYAHCRNDVASALGVTL